MVITLEEATDHRWMPLRSEFKEIGNPELCRLVDDLLGHVAVCHHRRDRHRALLVSCDGGTQLP
jgi:hypothetical protein